MSEYSMKVGRYTVNVTNNGDVVYRNEHKVVSAELWGELEITAAIKVLKEQTDIGGEELKFVRHAFMMTQKDFARELGVLVQEVQDWESNKTAVDKYIVETCLSLLEGKFL